MRNLKRVLSMALASMMVLGLTVVGANAANFNDQAEITHTTAADVMTAIGVLEGNEKGDFLPNEVLTREQAAKIVCYMLMGPENAEKLGVSGTQFTDVAADRWSAPYISYCANMGILVGDGTGKFLPEAQLTGHAFAKMMLTALGYDAKIQNYTGASWAINVATDAVNAGIFVDGTVMSDPMTRDQAAQMAFQTLSADMVKYSNKGTNITIGGVEIAQGASAPEKVAVTGKGYDGKEDGYQQFCEKYFKDLEKATTNETDDLGRPAVTWSYDGDEVSTVADSADKTLVVDEKYTSYEKALQELLDNDDATIAGDKVTLNGAKVSDTTAKIGDVLYVYETDTKNVYNVVVAQYSFAIVDEVDTDVSSKDEKDGVKSYITLDKVSGVKDVKDTEFPGFAYEKGDAIAVALNGTKVVDSYALKTVEGTATAKDSKNAAYLRLDGTKYEVATLGKDSVTADKVELGETYTLYTDANGYVMYIEGETTAVTLDDVYYISAVRSESSYNTTYYGQIVALDGTIQEVKLAKVDGSTPQTGASFTAGLYTLEKDGSSYNATALKNTADYSQFQVADGSAKEFKVTTSTGNLSQASNKGYITKDTVFVVISGTDPEDLTVKTYTGPSNITISADDKAKVTVITDANSNKSETVGDALYVVITANGEASTAAESNSVLFLASVGEQVLVDGKDSSDKFYAATAYDMSGKEMEIVVDSEYAANKLYTYSVDDADVYGLKSYTPGAIDDNEGYAVDATISGVYRDTRVQWGNYDYDASNAVIVDNRTDPETEINSLAKLDDAIKDGKTVTATLYVDDYVQVIFITTVA